MLTEVAAWCFRFFVRYSIITGAVKNRDEQVTAFQNDCQPDSGPGVTVFIGQIATAGLGITLTAASTMVFYSLGYSMSNFEQTKARIHRVGQRNACTYIYLTAKGTVDEKVLRALLDKADLAKLLIDDYRSGQNPFAPHLLYPQFMDDADEDERALGLFMGVILLTKCHELWFFGDTISAGMAIEIERAVKRGMTVRHFTEDCKEVEPCASPKK